MVLKAVKCPDCDGENISKRGKSDSGKQRYSCNDCGKSFQDGYVYNGYKDHIISDIFFQTINGSGVRAIARSLGISQDKVIKTLRSFDADLWYVNFNYLEKMKHESIEIEIVSSLEIEMDEMWSFVHDKSQEYWLWWEIDHNTGEALAFHFGDRKHKNLDALLKQLESFPFVKVYADENQGKSMNKALYIRILFVKNQNDIVFRDKNRVDLSLPRRFKHEYSF